MEINHVLDNPLHYKNIYEEECYTVLKKRYPLLYRKIQGSNECKHNKGKTAKEVLCNFYKELGKELCCFFNTLECLNGKESLMEFICKTKRVIEALCESSESSESEEEE